MQCRASSKSDTRAPTSERNFGRVSLQTSRRSWAPPPLELTRMLMAGSWQAPGRLLAGSWQAPGSWRGARGEQRDGAEGRGGVPCAGEDKEVIDEEHARIIELKASLASNGANIEQTKRDIAVNLEAQRDATAMRDKEHAEYSADRTESEQCSGALEAAVKVLTGAGEKKGAFLETMREARGAGGVGSGRDGGPAPEGSAGGRSGVRPEAAWSPSEGRPECRSELGAPGSDLSAHVCHFGESSLGGARGQLHCHSVAQTDARGRIRQRKVVHADFLD